MKLTAILAGSAIAAAGLAAAPPAAAEPGDPAAGCEMQLFVKYCDGPLREDGSWQRCITTYPTNGSVRGAIVRPTHVCREISLPVPPTPAGQPPYHIE